MQNIEIVKIKMVKDRELRNEYDQKIGTPFSLYKILRTLLEEEDRENFLVISLDTKNHINGINVISTGTLNSSLAHPREVFKMAILNNSNSIIIAHNHPSGDTEPSNEDIKVTDRLIECGKILGIEVLDHIIVGEGYYSFKEKGKIR